MSYQMQVSALSLFQGYALLSERPADLDITIRLAYRHQ
jgi:hypothetical protein